MNNRLSNPGKTALGHLSNPGLLISECYIGGEWVSGDDAADVIDPGTLLPVAKAAQCGIRAVDACIHHAQSAQRIWQGLMPVARGEVLRKWAALIRDNADDLATIITVEQGKPLFESIGEIQYGAAFLDWFTSEGERAPGHTFPAHKTNMFTTNYAQPVGISLAVTPWNFPLAMITRKAGAPLAAGCPMIVKPASATPLTANALAYLAQKTGIPGGVFQVVQGPSSSLCTAFLKRPEIRALSFTGSTRVGQILLAQAADTIKRCSMELGGNAPFIVFEDANLDQAVETCMSAKFATSGQDCLAANRIYVHDSLHDAFVDKLAANLAKLRVGHGLEDGIDIGPMTVSNTPQSCARIEADAVREGAEIVAGKAPRNDGTYFINPVMLTGVTDTMEIAREEMFAPVVSVLRFTDTADVLTRANDTEMGLAAYICTQSVNTALWASEALEYGMVAVNTPPSPARLCPLAAGNNRGWGARDQPLAFMSIWRIRT